ncbi:cytochrome d ubiquinol oxidase subunit II [Sediminitomix flava]|uniref:Cytochrome bd-I ubiquinol oxidase subunit 2 apoprotein n=1 Tax=Sediminitomix flava TaxID=379075 RepID=A0A315Z7X1_SEDFL|nr:cytochrome d ubiquinol oxidase subunit II [Sediminitomix flava]PWJ40758.1 cytochrome bd-I ubiquinol oxidase subunit 2 apoprotein [Sediminitomix flava]
MDYNVIWYILVGVLLIGYAILDGFDLGVGALHLLAKGDHNRRIVMNSIGPVWDGNEVWLITAGGAVFAAFPHVYATAFSGFYIPFMLLLAALIFRAVAMEFRSKEPHRRWRQFWDAAFSISSAIAATLFGVTIGNAVTGINIGADKEYQGTLMELLNPYALMIGFFVLTVFTLHGSLYLIIKTEGELQKQVKQWAMKVYWIFIIFYIIVTGYTLFLHPEMIANFSFGKINYIGGRHELIDHYDTFVSITAWIIVILNGLAVLNIHRCLVKGLEHQGFISSALSIGAMVGLFALGIFPNMIVSTFDPTYSLDIYNASSSQKTLKTMFYIALVGIPFVLSYTIAIYWVFRGKTQLDENSY